MNKVFLMGNLGRDPELKTFDDGSTITNASLATNKKYKDRSGEWQTLTEWHRLVGRGSLGERLAKSKSGDMLHIEGELSTRSYDDAHGNKRYVTEIKVTSFRNISNVFNRETESVSNETTPKTVPDDSEGDDLPF